VTEVKEMRRQAIEALNELQVLKQTVFTLEEAVQETTESTDEATQLAHKEGYSLQFINEMTKSIHFQADEIQNVSWIPSCS